MLESFRKGENHIVVGSSRRSDGRRDDAGGPRRVQGNRQPRPVARVRTKCDTRRNSLTSSRARSSTYRSTTIRRLASTERSNWRPENNHDWRDQLRHSDGRGQFLRGGKLPHRGRSMAGVHRQQTRCHRGDNQTEHLGQWHHGRRYQTASWDMPRQATR